MESNSVVLYRRDKPHKEKIILSVEDCVSKVSGILDDMQNQLHAEACDNLNRNTNRDLKTFDDFKAFFTPKNEEKPEIHGGFVHAKWCGDKEMEAKLSDLKVTIRCLPLEQSGTQGKCIVTGRDATIDAIFAKAY